MTLGYLTKRSERNLTQAILRMLCYMPDTFAWEMDTKATGFKDKQGNQRYIKTMSRGKADIGACVAGLSVVMEVKLPGEKLRPHQEHWRECYMRGKGFYFVVHSAQEAEDAWNHVMNFATKNYMQARLKEERV